MGIGFGYTKKAMVKTIYDIYELPYDYDINQLDPLSYFPEEYHQLATNTIKKAITESLKWDQELMLNTMGNNTIWVRSIGESLCDENGVMVKLRGVLMDIDQYKNNEILLNSSIKLLSSNNLQLKNFTHILSHNIRNHASNISLLMTLIDKSELKGENLELIENANEVSVALNTTLDDLSAAIKVREDKVESTLLNFEEEYQKIFKIIGPEMQSHNASVRVLFNEKEVLFPEIYLQSIMVNLLTNAIKYRKPNVEPVIVLRTYRNEQQQTIQECSDNGIGIDLKLHKNNIFGLYKTFHGHKDAHGVGLFLVKTQIESQGGQVTVESTPGIGSSFKVIFNLQSNYPATDLNSL
jgi:light-regulated signal transduction histidine kinase (bacteriophytochrome)